MSKVHFFQAQNIAAQLSIAPALWLLNVVPSLCGSSMRDLETSFKKRINEEKKHFFPRDVFNYQLMNFLVSWRELNMYSLLLFLAHMCYLITL